MGVRRQSREVALQVLFQAEFSSDPESEFPFEKSLEVFRSSFDFSRDVWSYAEVILQGIFANKNQIDTLIDSTSTNWRLARMPLVDANILRIAVFELQFGAEAPPKVVINEALEIARKYGGTESSQFINGILDQLIPK